MLFVVGSFPLEQWEYSLLNVSDSCIVSNALVLLGSTL